MKRYIFVTVLGKKFLTGWNYCVDFYVTYYMYSILYEFI